MTTPYSHPGVPLVDHLEQVAANCREIVRQKKLYVPVPGTVIEDLCYLMGALHDFGKATRFFQHYLLSDTHAVIGPKHHALLSAVLCHQVAERYIETVELDVPTKQLLPYLVFVAVKRHHGNLQDIETELVAWHKKPEELVEQVQEIDGAYAQSLFDRLLAPLNLAYDWDMFSMFIQQKAYVQTFELFFIEHIQLGYFRQADAQAKSGLYYLFHLLYSTLLLADKRDVVLRRRPDYQPINDGSVTQYRTASGFDRPQTALNHLQNDAYLSSIAHLPQVLDSRQHLYSITLPTGLGKTVTSVGIALEMRKLLALPDHRLIIAIPFTSIIDQNYLVYEKVFQARDSSQLLKHHHLSDPVYKVEDDALSADESQFLIETWDSQVVVTTFVQLIEALFANDKSKLLKLPQLVNSIVILDEVQSIPYALWPLIRMGIRQVAKQFNTYFIFMSATQPLIFEPGSEIVELVPDYRRFFGHSLFNRTRLVNRLEPIRTMEEFLSEVIDYARAHPQKDILIILNTKDATRQCFAGIHAARLEKTDLFFLSTYITPHERKRIIEAVKQPSPDRRIIVSTQLVEAGVDISVDTVFRALAPLDSIIQAAGRANRYNEKASQAEVFIYEIEELRKGSSMIYGAELLQKTRNVLGKTPSWDEQDYLALVEAYYRQVSRQAEAVKQDTLDHLLSLKFGKVGEFRLIEEQHAESIFIQLNDEAVAIWDRYEALLNDKSLMPYERARRFEEIKARFYDFVISVPKRGNLPIAFDGERIGAFYLSRLGHPSAFYAHDYDGNGEQLNTGYSNKQTSHFF